MKPSPSKGDKLQTINHSKNMQNALLHPIDIAEFSAEVNAETHNNKLFDRKAIAQQLLKLRREKAVQALNKAVRELNRLRELEKHVQKFGI